MNTHIRTLIWTYSNYCRSHINRWSENSQKRSIFNLVPQSLLLFFRFTPTTSDINCNEERFSVFWHPFLIASRTEMIPVSIMAEERSQVQNKNAIATKDDLRPNSSILEMWNISQFAKSYNGQNLIKVHRHYVRRRGHYFTLSIISSKVFFRFNTRILKLFLFFPYSRYPENKDQRFWYNIHRGYKIKGIVQLQTTFPTVTSHFFIKLLFSNWCQLDKNEDESFCVVTRKRESERKKVYDFHSA